MTVDSIKRYRDRDAADIWSDDTKFVLWATVEIAAARAQGAPLKVINDMLAAPIPTPDQVEHEERNTRHDVVAFLNVWRSRMLPETRIWTHKNLTSSDLVDTVNAMRMANAIDLVCDRLDNRLTRTAARHARKHWDSVRVGRTHGQTAEVTTWGHRIADFAFALDRAANRLRSFRHHIAVGKMSGPVGDFKRTTPAQEQRVMSALNLSVPSVSTQVVMRDVYADFVFGMAQVATVIEAIAMEIRLSSRTDTGEVAEDFGHEQRGSSAMPHKRNPIVSEKLCGLARLVRSQIEPVMQGVALHHERDISHSSVERVALEEVTLLVVYMINQADDLLRTLDVKVDVMKKRAQNSPELLTATVKDYLIENGVDPDTAWTLVGNAHRDYAEGCTFGFAGSLELAWATVNRHGPLPGVSGEFKPNFVDVLAPLADPASMIGRTDHVYADLDSLAGGM